MNITNCIIAELFLYRRHCAIGWKLVADDWWYKLFPECVQAPSKGKIQSNWGKVAQQKKLLICWDSSINLGVQKKMTMMDHQNNLIIMIQTQMKAMIQIQSPTFPPWTFRARKAGKCSFGGRAKSFWRKTMDGRRSGSRCSWREMQVRQH